MNGKLVEQAPRNVLKRVVADAAAKGYTLKTRRRVRVLPDHARRRRDLRLRPIIKPSPATTSRR